MKELSIQQELKGTVFETGYQIAKEKWLAIVWMSVWNSYFGEESIQDIVSFADKTFSKTKFLIPFEPAIYTYLAIGYNEEKARTKARLGSNRLVNHTVRAIDGGKNMDIVNWNDEVYNNKNYQESLTEIMNLYLENQKFREDAKETTKQVLEEKTKDQINLERATEIGVTYLLQELAFVLVSPSIFNVSKTVYIYHRQWPIFEKLINGKYDWRERHNNWFLLVK